MHWQVRVLVGATLLQGVLSQEIPPFLAPADGTNYTGWLENATTWQELTVASMGYDPLFPQSVYNQATAFWAQSCFLQLHVMVYDGRIYNPNPLVANLSLLQYLNEVENRTGPVDAVVLWYQLPALGLDQRSQLELLRGIPGGADTLRELAIELAERTPVVALMVGYVPWDIYTTPGAQPDNSSLTTMLFNSTASGIVGRDTPFLDISFFWYNTSSGTPVASFVLQGEGPLSAPAAPWPSLSFTAMTSATSGFDVSPYSSYRWLEDRHTPLYGSLWSKNKTLDILSAFVSAAGTQFCEHLFGFSNIVTPRDAALLLRANSISRYLSPIIRYSAYPIVSGPLPDGIPNLHWLPYYLSDAPDVVISAFYAACPSAAYGVGDRFASAYDVTVLARRARQQSRWSDAPANCTVFLLANYGATDAIDIQVNVSIVNLNMGSGPIYWYDMYLGQPINSSDSSLRSAPFSPGTVSNMTLTTSVEAGGIGAIFASSTNITTDLQSFLTLMSSNITVAPLASYDATWAPLAQVMSPVIPTPGFSTAPDNMVLVVGMQGYAWSVDAILPYMFYEPAAGDVASSAGVDVQYPWESIPLAQHAATFDIAPFYMDLYLATNEDYRLFLLGSGYVPIGSPNNFLRNWITYPNGTWSYNETVRDCMRCSAMLEVALILLCRLVMHGGLLPGSPFLMRKCFVLGKLRGFPLK
jgi:iron(II)-dependent oxidoreductase